MSLVNTIKEKLHSKMSQDVIWTFAVQMIVMLCSFAVNKILSVRLGVDDFGAYNVVKRSVVVISFVMLAGAGISIPRYLAMYLGKNDFNKAKTFLISSVVYVLTVSLLIGIIALIFKSFLSDLIIGYDDTLLYSLAFVYSFVLASSSFLFAYYRGKNDFKKYNISQVLVQLLLIVPILILPELTLFNVFGYWTLTTLLVVLFYWFFNVRRESLKTDTKPSKYDIAVELKEISKYSLPRLVGDFFLFTFSAFPVIYVSKVLDNASVSFYSVGITIVTIATPLFSILGTILLPYVSKSIATGQMQNAEKFINKLLIIYILSSIIIIFAFYFLANFMITLLFSEQYLPALRITQILIWSILPQSLYLLFRNPIDAVTITPYNTIVLGISLAILVVLFCLNSTLEQFAWSYVIVSAVQGLASWGVWKAVK